MRVYAVGLRRVAPIGVTSQPYACSLHVASLQSSTLSVSQERSTVERAAHVWGGVAMARLGLQSGSGFSEEYGGCRVAAFHAVYTTATL